MATRYRRQDWPRTTPYRMPWSWMRPHGSNLLVTARRSAPPMIAWAKGTLNFKCALNLSGNMSSSSASWRSSFFFPVPCGWRIKAFYAEQIGSKMLTVELHAYEHYHLDILIHEFWNSCGKNIWAFLLFQSAEKGYNRDVSVDRQTNFGL